MDKLILIAKAARVSQWIKNVVLLAPIVFSGLLFVEGYLLTVCWAAFLFCLLSSAVYIFNDMLDAPKDRLHPFKKLRPIASGKIPMPVAAFMFMALLSVTLWLGAMTSTFFFVTQVAYLVMNVLYSVWWKTIPIVDVFVIAAGFVLRVYGGGFVINAHMDVWFLLTVISASLFLAVGKRRSEMTLMEGRGGASRASLIHYTPALLDAYTSMFANTTWLTYALFTFLHPPFRADGKVLKLLALLPRTLVAEKWLMATVPVVIFGIMRYMQLIYEKNEGESPHKVLMSDRTLLVTVLVWGVMVIVMIYGV